MPYAAEEIPIFTSRKEAIKLCLKLQEETRQLERRVNILEFTSKSLKQYENVRTASSIGVVFGVHLN